MMYPFFAISTSENCDFFDAELLLLPGGMPGAATLDKHEGLRKLILDFAAKGKPIAAICAAPMVLGQAGTAERKEGYLLSEFRTISGWCRMCKCTCRT